jgi:hypothetical protein
MKIIELIIDEKDSLSGIDAVSVVENPAIEENFIALSKHEIELKEIDTEKKILMGAALVPNKQIYRRNDKNEEYYIFFSEDTIRRASELFLMNSNQNNTTYEHNEKLKGLTVVESWIIEDEKHDKSVKYGFNLPVGTWMISMKVNNEDVWKKVKDGSVKGFSIEGYFADKLEMSLNNIDEMEEKLMIDKIKELITKSELGSQNVELTAVDDLKNSIAKISSLNSNVTAMSKNSEKTNKLFKDALSQKDVLSQNYDDYRKVNENLQKELNSVFKIINNQAKELGININDLPIYKEFLSSKELLSELNNKVQSSWNLVSGYK